MKIKQCLSLFAVICSVLLLAACGSDMDSDYSIEATMPDDTPQGRSYVGTQICLACHADKESFLETGHNFKLNKIVDGQMPQYPFTSIAGALEQLEGIENTLGTPTSYTDVSYVIGGYKSSAMFLDLDGYIMNGTKAGASLGPDGTVAYMWPYGMGDGPESHPYDYCGRCHTTGWKDYTSKEGDNRNLNRQDDLPGMGGTFSQTGVQCESCHGAGSEHAKSPSKTNITRQAEGRLRSDLQADDMGYGQAMACAECHSKQGERLYTDDFFTPFNEAFGGDSLGGLVLADTGGRGGRGGRMATDTLLGIDPDTRVAMGKKKDFACSSCHEPHMSEFNKDKPGHEGAMVKECTDCHTDMEFGGGGMAAAMHEAADCVACHMPSGSHMFKIDISVESTDASHYSEDGVYSKPWLRASDSCQGCHEEDFEARAQTIGNIHL